MIKKTGKDIDGNDIEYYEEDEPFNESAALDKVLNKIGTSKPAEGFMEYLHRNKDGDDPGADNGFQQLEQNAGAIEHLDPDDIPENGLTPEGEAAVEGLLQQIYADWEGDEDPSDEEILAKVKELLDKLPDEANAGLAETLEIDNEPEEEEPGMALEEEPEEEEDDHGPTPGNLAHAKLKEGNALAKRIAEMGRF